MMSTTASPNKARQSNTDKGSSRPGDDNENLDFVHPDHIPLDHHAGGHHPRLERVSSIGPVVPEPHIQFPSCRLVLMGMAFFGFLNVYCLRVDLSVALVAMVNSTYAASQEHVDNDTNKEELCKADEHNKTIKETGEFNWDSTQQGVILAAFFYGYITTQIPGGTLAQKFGGKRLLLFGIFWTALLTLLTPVLTMYGGFGGLVATRVLEGIGEGVTYPSMHAMLSKWAPPLERSKMVTSVYAGAQIGTVVAMPLSGVLCDTPLGWPSVFYVFGALGVVWSIMWMFLVYDTPAQHPRIAKEELDYIELSQGMHGAKKGTIQVPWLKIATSLPVYATAIAHFCCNWGYYTLLTCLPTYLKYILKFDIKSNGLLSGLPYLVMWIVMMASGFVADQLISKKFLSTTVVRKLFNALGFLGPAGCLIATGYIDCQPALAVSLIVIAVGLSGLSMAGWAVNHLDLAPPYAGTLMGITNGLATIPGFIGPSVVGALTHNNQTRAAWRKVFYITAGVYAFGTVFYAVFGSGRKQSWGVTDEEKDAKGD